MKTKMKSSRYWATRSFYWGSAVCVVLLAGGCASTHKTTTTETTVASSYPSTVGAGTAESQNRVAVDKSETTTATTETKPAHPGMLSSTVHAIGWVIALPFKLIGGLIGWIF